ncbi:hypothetical protein BKA58DRAFT_368675 [Alternaria rosae]|uniref:uncharacterized protein n=1 Tax=Alternaria rosae TaxID=1187941 RepID=UPI001E8CB8BF|nr:uncharacterized protein BKA58DRAFT_368675 [Alternaria rosae]KAH6861171.1 hypothetical protein BKA58DRAFT_368675 [Alternaria rosae]
MLQATAFFLKRDPLWTQEKPYTLRYQPAADLHLPRTNAIRETHVIDIHDIRCEEKPPEMDKQGFAVLRLQSQLGYTDYFNEVQVRQIYYPELQSALKDMFGATWVHVLEHTLRQRHPEFPISTGSDYDSYQPTLMAHIDSTHDYTMEEVLKAKGPDAALEKGRYMLVNSWKPLKGPLYDWPLALCDASTANATEDFVRGDIVYTTHVTENYRVHHSEQQRWFYLSRQTPSELLIFKQSDSKDGACASVPHTSFENPATPVTEAPRESIETRNIIFIKDN